MALKYENPHLKNMARSLRKKMTDTERKMWSILRGRKIKNLQFYRQRPIGVYIVDFYCPRKNLLIEIDGGQHYADETIKQDKERSAYLKEKFNLQILRFTNLEVLQNIEGVVKRIIDETK
jgi:very-short-patch-repair endonuclease